MWIYRITNSMFNKFGFRNLSSRKAVIPRPAALTAQEDDSFLQNKNVLISGEFFPDSEYTFKENLLKRNANLQSRMTPETEILICGKYPDWTLIREAKMNGLKIIFVDKASDLFTGLETDMQNTKPAACHQVPLGI